MHGSGARCGSTARSPPRRGDHRRALEALALRPWRRDLGVGQSNRDHDVRRLTEMSMRRREMTVQTAERRSRPCRDGEAQLAPRRIGRRPSGVIVVIGTIGYMLLGFGALDATYQTVTTITTVGFRGRSSRSSSAGKVFTIVPDPGGCRHGALHAQGRARAAGRGPLRRALGDDGWTSRSHRFRARHRLRMGRVGKAIARELRDRREAGRRSSTATR